MVDVGKAIVNVLANHLLDTDLLPPVKLPPYPEWYVGNYTGEVMPHLKVLFVAITNKFFLSSLLIIRAITFFMVISC